MESVNYWSLTKQDTLALKGIAICAMLFHHLYSSIPSWIEPYDGALAWMGNLGKVCVAMFLFCSGYGLAAQYDKVIGIKNTFRYMCKRFVSFYFNYWAVFFVFVPITVLLFHRPLSAAYGEHVNLIKRLGYDLLGIQGYMSYNITWWFNKLLLTLYLLFPILYLGVRKSGILTLLLSLLICRYWMVVVGYDYYGSLYIFQLSFVLGIIWNKWAKLDGIRWQMRNCHIGDICILKGQGKSYIFVMVASLVLLVMILFRMYPLIPHWTSIRMDAFVSLGAVLFVVSLRSIGTPMKALGFLGKHSANMYLLHTFYNGYWHLTWLHTGTVMRSGVNFFVLLAMCLLSSIILEWVKGKIGVYKILSIIKLKLS